MRGEKTIDLGFEITYSAGKEFRATTLVTVRAPGLSMYRTHALMQAWTTEGAVGWRKAFADQIAKAEPDAGKAATAPQPGGEVEAVDGDKQIDVMAMMAAGLPPERYAQFSLFVMDTLKNNAVLAYVGTPEHKSAINDHVLAEIEKNGGVEAWDKIASEFTGFFMLGQGSTAKPSGKSSSTSSASPTEEVSQTRKRVNSRLHG